jgi:hypothetical protein
MRNVSKKRAATNRLADKWRTAFKAEVGRCERCLKPASPEHLDADEIARGCDRRKALTARFAILCVHRQCHNEIQNWSRAKRLALLYLARSSDYDIEAFHELTGRCFPSQEDVDAEIVNLLAGRKRL